MQHDLKNLKKILQSMGNPQNKLKVIQIAGTNGKGSCGFLLSSLLRQSQYYFKNPVVGWFHSPAMFKNHDIQVNNISVDTEIVEKHARSLKQYKDDLLSAFERRVVIAVLVFIQFECDICIFECGLGGMYDATSIFKAKEMAIVTKIGLDHQDVLGMTLKEISTHKFSIANNCKFAITTEDQPSEVIDYNSMLENKATLVPVATIVEARKYSFKWKYKNLVVSTKLLGSHQGVNVSLALESTLLLKQFVFDYNCIKDIVWVGRLQYLRYKTNEILLDGSHNLDSISALKEYVDSFLKNEQLIIVFCTSGKNKNAEKMLDILQNGRNDEVFLSSFEIPIDVPWVEKTPIQNYGKYKINRSIRLENIEDIEEISNRTVLVCGSLYFVREALLLFQSRKQAVSKQIYHD
eukprot:NODE_294_length_11497_cov_0.618530.p2 type:complete len:406 gc:universal NODE_294_length_11497_cov_0.618530:610-1827(+)